MRIPSPRSSALLAYAVLSIGSVDAVQAADSLGHQLYAPCVVCHQPNAGGSPDGLIPSLAGQQQPYLAKQLAAFQSGVRVDTAMQLVGHAQFGDAHNIDAVANYLAALDPNPNPVRGAGAHLRIGQETYTHICAACHGSDGGGRAATRVPRIAGQHYPYLRRQIDAAADLHRELAPPEMTSALRSMSDPQKDAVADYVARLGASPALLDVNPTGK